MGASVGPASGLLVRTLLITCSIALAGGARTYPIRFRDPNATCTGAHLDLSNGLQLAWSP
jgi:hypothetical protein